MEIFQNNYNHLVDLIELFFGPFEFFFVSFEYFIKKFPVALMYFFDCEIVFFQLCKEILKIFRFCIKSEVEFEIFDFEL
jgi:hypothetical protein